MISRYQAYYKQSIDVHDLECTFPEYDVFISSYNDSERVVTVFDKVSARQKIWHIHPEYQYKPIEVSHLSMWPMSMPSNSKEMQQVKSILDIVEINQHTRVCIDITGFMRHVLVYLIARLSFIGVKKVVALYSEPLYYTSQERTSFSTKTTGNVGPIQGTTIHPHASGGDYLILGVGYDNKLISEIANYKEGAVVYPVFAFPSLSPDMYQQSAIRSAQCGAVIHKGDWSTNRNFAPANDPFATASVISDIVSNILNVDSSANIYLSPLSTKAQVLGHAIYWLLEGQMLDRVSMLLPECLCYSRETSKGLKRLWRYVVEL